MRLFVESVLGSSALDEVWSVGEQMRGEPGFPHGAVRWVKREAMHLTLRFLGEVNEDRLPEMIGALAELQGSRSIRPAIGHRWFVRWSSAAGDLGWDRTG